MYQPAAEGTALPEQGLQAVLTLLLVLAVAVNASDWAVCLLSPLRGLPAVLHRLRKKTAKPGSARPAVMVCVCADLRGSRVRGPANLEVSFPSYPDSIAALREGTADVFRRHLNALSAGVPGIEPAGSFSIAKLFIWESDAAGWQPLVSVRQLGVLDQLYATRDESAAPTDQHRCELPAPRSAAEPRRVTGEPLLPPQPLKQKGKLTVVLDLDETLLHRRRGGVLYRPHWEELLDGIKDTCEVVLWTASREETMPGVLRVLDPNGDRFHHKIYRSDRWFHSPYGHFDPGVKDLSLLGRDLSRCIIVDNSVGCVERNPEHAVVVPSYEAADDRDGVLVVVRRLIQWIVLRVPGQTVPELLMASRLVVPATAPADEQLLPYHHYRPSPIALETAMGADSSEVYPEDPEVFETYEVGGRYFQVMGFAWDHKEGDYCIVSRPLFAGAPAYNLVPTRCFAAYEGRTRMERLHYGHLDEEARRRVRTGRFWLDPDWRVPAPAPTGQPIDLDTIGKPLHDLDEAGSLLSKAAPPRIQMRSPQQESGDGFASIRVAPPPSGRLGQMGVAGARR